MNSKIKKSQKEGSNICWLDRLEYKKIYNFAEFAEHIPDIYPRELQLNKANTSDKETS